MNLHFKEERKGLCGIFNSHTFQAWQSSLSVTPSDREFKPFASAHVSASAPDLCIPVKSINFANENNAI